MRPVHFASWFVAGLLLLGCARDSEEARLQQALDELVSAVEARSVKKVSAGLSENFRTSRQTGVDDIRSFMLLQFRSNRVIHVFPSNQQLLLQGEQGQIGFDVLVTGSSHWLPERGRRFYVRTGWIKQDGDWKLAQLDWEARGDQSTNY